MSGSSKGDQTAPVRCSWATSDELVRYHDEEWGVPVHDDRTLFEFLCLEGAQAGLSWETILRKRDAYRRAFAEFEPAKVARFTFKRIERLLTDPGIVRNRAKIESTIGNARSFLAVQHEFGSFARYVWRFVGDAPIDGRRRKGGPIPATTRVSEALSKDLRARGFRFVGPTIAYAFMQAVGMVNDHLLTCAWHDKMVRAPLRPSTSSRTAPAESRKRRTPR